MKVHVYDTMIIYDNISIIIAICLNFFFCVPRDNPSMSEVSDPTSPSTASTAVPGV